MSTNASTERLTALADAQRRLQLVLRSQHGPRARSVWCDACAAAGVLGTGDLTLDELDRVTAVLAARGGTDAVAARSCRVKLVFLRRSAPDRAPDPDGELLAALCEPEAMDEQAWLRRLSELEESLPEPRGATAP